MWRQADSVREKNYNSMNVNLPRYMLFSEQMEKMLFRERVVHEQRASSNLQKELGVEEGRSGIRKIIMGTEQEYAITISFQGIVSILNFLK